MSHLPGSVRIDPEGDCDLSSLGISLAEKNTGISHTCFPVIMMSSHNIPTMQWCAIVRWAIALAKWPRSCSNHTHREIIVGTIPCHHWMFLTWKGVYSSGHVKEGK